MAQDYYLRGVWRSTTRYITGNKGFTMKESNNTQPAGKKRGIIETSVYCMNTKRKYIYELSGGVIVSERVVQCAE